MSDPRRNPYFNPRKERDLEVLSSGRLTRLQKQLRVLEVTQNLTRAQEDLEAAKARVKELERKTRRLAIQRDLYMRLQQGNPRGQ